MIKTIKKALSFILPMGNPVTTYKLDNRIAALEYFSADEVRILSSVWGESRLAQLSADVSHNEKLKDAISISNLSDAIKCKKLKDSYKSYEGNNAFLACGPTLLRNMKCLAIINRVIEEGRLKSEIALKQVATISEDPLNPHAPENDLQEKLFARIKSYNIHAQDDSKLIISSIDDIEDYARLARRIKDRNARTSKEKRALAMHHIIMSLSAEMDFEDISFNNSNGQDNNRKQRHSLAIRRRSNFSDRHDLSNVVSFPGYKT